MEEEACEEEEEEGGVTSDLQGGSDLEDGSVVEQGQQLQQVVQDVAFLLLHPQDVGRVERFGAVHLHLLVEGKKPKLEEVLDDDGDLRTRGTRRTRQPQTTLTLTANPDDASQVRGQGRGQVRGQGEQTGEGTVSRQVRGQGRGQ